MHYVACCSILLELKLFHFNAIQLGNDLMSNNGSIALSIAWNVLFFIIFEEIWT